VEGEPADGKKQRFGLALPKLTSGQSHKWQEVFKDPGLFGANIKNVEVTWRSTEWEAWCRAFKKRT